MYLSDAFDILPRDHLSVTGPPPGTVPNYIDPPNNATSCQVVSIITLALAFVLVVSRIGTKIFIVRRFGWDDCEFAHFNLPLKRTAYHTFELDAAILAMVWWSLKCLWIELGSQRYRVLSFWRRAESFARLWVCCLYPPMRNYKTHALLAITPLGFGRHIWDIPPENIKMMYRASLHSIHDLEGNTSLTIY